MKRLILLLPIASLVWASACGAPTRAASIAPAAVVAKESASGSAAGTTPVTASRLLVREIHSSLLNRSLRVLIYLPPGYSPRRRYPTIYMLHGVPGTPDGLFQNLDLTSHLDRLITSGSMPPSIVVAPTGGPTPSTDTEWSDSFVDPSQRWGSFLADELVPWVDRSFSTCHDRDDRAVSGLSMGAFGAMNLALKRPDLFGVVTSWSGYFTANTPSVEGEPGSPGWRRDSPLIYVPQMQPPLDKDRVRISFYVGSSDAFAPSNEAFDRLLTRLGVPHRFRTVPGGHDWAVWRSQLDDELTWTGRSFTCEPARAGA